MKVNVGESCQNKRCWFWHHKAIKNCAAHDTGSTHLLASDISRIYKENLETAELRIDRGRDKLSAWLSLISHIDDVEIDGCKRCGSPTCNGGSACQSRLKSIAAVQDQLPLNNVIHMNNAKWYATVQAKNQENLAFSIDLDGI
jgi:hypothetical protein